MDFNAYSRDINEIDDVVSTYLASRLGTSQFDKIRKKFLEGFEVGWKFTKAGSGKQNNKFFAKIQNKQVLKMAEYGLVDKPDECSQSFGIVVSSLRNNPHFIFSAPVSIGVYYQFFEIVAAKKPEFKKFLQNVVMGLQKSASYASRDWNDNQKTEYVQFLANLYKLSE